MRRASYRLLRKMRAVLPASSSPRAGASPFRARLLRWTRATLVPKSKIWVQVEHGVAKGLWMRLHLPDETFLWRGDHEPDVQGVLAKFLKPRWVAYDIGSYVGFFTLAMAKVVGHEGRAFAFEPDPENAARIREHVAKNRLPAQIQVVEAAVWRTTNESPISYRRGLQARSQGGVEADGLRPVLASGEHILVPSISLDEFIAHGNPAPQLIKIDVEGGETAVLAGAERLLTEHMPVIICEVHHAEAARWIEEWLPARGYRLDWLIPPEQFPRRLLAQAPSSTV
ncbi:MAG TPA: FkbM family methyltransferase [Terriglobales bacterium]|nr:FkbM family methyltransferase [Terriglobales bacterium]